MIVLDTHTWWWMTSAVDLISARAADEISSASTIGISSVSIWEVGMLVNRRRIELDRSVSSWIAAALAYDPRFREIHVDGAIAMRATKLEETVRRGDPADLFLLATAELYEAKLVTKDRRLREVAPDLTIW